MEQAGGRARRVVRAGGRCAGRDLSPAADGTLQHGVHAGKQLSGPPIRCGDATGKGTGRLFHSTECRAGRYRQRNLHGDLAQPRPPLHHLPLLRSGASLRRSRSRRFGLLLAKRSLLILQAFVPSPRRGVSFARPVGPGRPLRALLVRRGQGRTCAADQRPRHPGGLPPPDQVAGFADPPRALLRLGQASSGEMALSNSAGPPGLRRSRRSGRALRPTNGRALRANLPFVDARRPRATRRGAEVAGGRAAGNPGQPRHLRVDPCAAQQCKARPRGAAAPRDRAGGDRAAGLHRRHQPYRHDISASSVVARSPVLGTAALRIDGAGAVPPANTPPSQARPRIPAGPTRKSY